MAGLLPDYTISGDAVPLWSEAPPEGPIDSSQYGFPLTGGTTRIYTKAQIWAQDASRRRHGTYGIKCSGFRDATNLANNTHSMGMGIIVPMGTASRAVLEGDEEWVGWSWWFPDTWAGSGPGTAWCNLWEWGSGDAQWHPRNGSGFEAYDPARLVWTIHNGRTQSPGGEAGFDYNGTYNVTETLLGTGSPRPFTKNVWHDFYMHTIYRAQAPYTSTNSVAEIWHREEGGSFEKLYSNKNDGSALINRAPHPTWYYNSAWGVPGGSGTAGTSKDPAHWLGYRTYRSQATFNTTHDLIYWADGFFRRQSQQAILNEFAASGAPTAPTISSFSPTSGTAGVTSVVITGTNFTGASLVSFNGVASSYVVNSATQITATVPASATTGKIQVTNPSGTGISSTDFTVGVTAPLVLPDPAAGHLRVGNSQEGAYAIASPAADNKRVIKRNVGIGNTVSIDQAYALLVGPASGGAELLKMVVYDDDGASALPGTRLGSSDEVSVAQSAAATWVSFSFSTPVLAAGGSTGDLYFGLHFGGTGAVSFSYQTATGQGWRLSDTYSDGPSNPFGLNPIVINIEPSFVIDYSVTGDSVAPSFIAASISAADLVLTYDEALDPASVPAPSAFAVTVNQASWPVAAVGLNAASVLVTLGNPIVAADIVTVAYTQPGSNPLQDVAGNTSATLAAQSVANNTQQVGARRIDPAARAAIARRIDAAHRRAGEGGGL